MNIGQWYSLLMLSFQTTNATQERIGANPFVANQQPPRIQESTSAEKTEPRDQGEELVKSRYDWDTTGARSGVILGYSCHLCVVAFNLLPNVGGQLLIAWYHLLFQDGGQWWTAWRQAAVRGQATRRSATFGSGGARRKETGTEYTQYLSTFPYTTRSGSKIVIYCCVFCFFLRFTLLIRQRRRFYAAWKKIVRKRRKNYREMPTKAVSNFLKNLTQLSSSA